MTETTTARPVLVIGAGPGGCACALWLAQMGHRCLVIDRAARPMANLRRIALRQDWVLGEPDTSTGDLADRYEAHLKRQPGIELRCGVELAELARVDDAGGIRQVTLSDGTRVDCAAIVVATGLRSRRDDRYAAAQPLDAEGLTARRDPLRGRRILLLGGGDNAVENALFLAERGNDVVLWSRGPLRSQRFLQAQLAAQPGISPRIGVALPTSATRDANGVVVDSEAFGRETFDEMAVLFGFEPEDAVLALLGRTPADALPPGLFLAGDISGRLHPCIHSALADGVHAAQQVNRWLDRVATAATTGSAISPQEHGQHTLTITGLRFDANLGILDHEKTAPQPIRVDAELNLGPQPLLPRDDDIGHVLDYRKVRRIIIDECTAEHVNLLESLIGKLAHRLMLLPGVKGVRVRIAKLEIFDDCEVAIRAETGQW